MDETEDAPLAAPEPVAEATEPVAAPETPAPTPEPVAAAPEAQKPPVIVEDAHDKKTVEQIRKRLGIVTAKGLAAEKAREAAEARAAAAEALLLERRSVDGEPPAQPKPHTPSDIRAEAARLVQEERYNERRTSVIAAGTKEFGQEAWNEKTTVLAQLGATDNPAFMEALVDLSDEAPKLVAALADDIDGLDALLKLSPAAMAARMGRMAEKLATPAAPAPVKITAAPKPVTPVAGRAQNVPTAYDDKLSMSEYVALRAKTAPRHLGGTGKRD